MAKFTCFSVLVGRKKKNGNKVNQNSLDTIGQRKVITLDANTESDKLNVANVSAVIPIINFHKKYIVVSDKNPLAGEAADVAYEEEDEHEENSTIKRDFSDANTESVENLNDVVPIINFHKKCTVVSQENPLAMAYEKEDEHEENSTIKRDFSDSNTENGKLNVANVSAVVPIINFHKKFIVVSDENPLAGETAEVAYEEEDENEENSTIKRDFSDANTESDKLNAANVSDVVPIINFHKKCVVVSHENPLPGKAAEVAYEEEDEHEENPTSKRDFSDVNTESDKLNVENVSDVVPIINFHKKCVVVNHENPLAGEAAEVAYEEEDEHEDSSTIKRDFSDANTESDKLNVSNLSDEVPIINFHKKFIVVSHGNPLYGEAAEVAYEGEDEHEDNSTIKRDFSDFDLQAQDANFDKKLLDSRSNIINFPYESKTEKLIEKSFEIETGHASNPGIAEAEVLKNIVSKMRPSKSQSFEELQKIEEENYINPDSPMSVLTHCSADDVMLKNHSSSQVLPSRSRKLWWKLFLLNHRNMHRALNETPQSLPLLSSHGQNLQGGYSSDTLEPIQVMELQNMESPQSFTGESTDKGTKDNKTDNKGWDVFHGTGLQNQWVAFATESSSFARVNEWVKDLESQPPIADNDDDNDNEVICFPPSPENKRSPERSTSHLAKFPDINLSGESLLANNLIQTLNSSSAVAHIRGVGLKVIPTMSCFASLRIVNLSNNFIAQITPGVLPKGLNTLNLSRNKINTIEGLRELTRLRILDLSYNRISKIGQGLSNCTLIKELYLAGNKVSEVEGLHRLLKLTVLDLSFNKITTTKALGQLVAHYNSLLALNLLGSPIQSNNDQVRKAVCGLLPKLVYLNKQPIKPHMTREVLGDSVAKAALGKGSWDSRRKAVKKVSQVGSLPTTGHRSTNITQSRPKSRSNQLVRQQTAPPAFVSSSR